MNIKQIFPCHKYSMKSILVKRGFTLPTSHKLPSNSEEMLLGRQQSPVARTLQKMFSLDSDDDRVCITVLLINSVI